MVLQYSNKLRQRFPGKWDWSSIVLEEPLSVSSKYQEVAGLQMPEPYYDHRAFANGGGASTPRPELKNCLFVLYLPSILVSGR